MWLCLVDENRVRPCCCCYCGLVMIKMERAQLDCFEDDDDDGEVDYFADDCDGEK